MQAASFEEAIEQIAARDRRYHREAYFFLREALDHTQKMIGKLPKKNEVRHVSGQELLNGIREYARSEEHTSELQSQSNLVCRLLLEKKKKKKKQDKHKQIHNNKDSIVRR